MIDEKQLLKLPNASLIEGHMNSNSNSETSSISTNANTSNNEQTGQIVSDSPRGEGKSWTRRAFISSIIGMVATGAAASLLPDKEESMDPTKRRQTRLPTLYIPHGGGPCFFMDWTMGPPDTWDRMAAWLKTLGDRFSDVQAILVVSAHWEERIVTVQNGQTPSLLFDYHGFPQHTYELTWPAPGAPDVAARARDLLASAGIESNDNPTRGFDHGVFVPLKLGFPNATIPTFQLSLDASLDAETHLRIGHALAPLRDEGVLMVGSGMSFHNMGAMMGRGSSLERSQAFDDWLSGVCEGDPDARHRQLASWQQGPQARYSHPREEHLLPLMVVAGAASNEPGRRVFSDLVMGVEVSAFEFGDAGPG